MGIVRGTNVTTDGLVYGYDTGYGVADNHTATRFFPGRPTTNMYTNSDFSNGTTGWTFASWDGNISYAAVNGIIGPYGKPVSALKLTVNSSSSYSHFHQYNNSKYTSGNSYTQSAWVKGTGNMWGKSHWGGNTNFTMTGDWQYITYTVSATSSSSGNFPYWGGEGLTAGTVFYMTNAQTEAKPNATPYVASGSTTGSRSATASLIDLERTANIDVSNMSFDSTSQPVFDGTDDYITAPANPQHNKTAASWEFVVKFDQTYDDDTSIYRQIYSQDPAIWIAQYKNSSNADMIGIDLQKDNGNWFDGNGGMNNGAQVGPVDANIWYHVIFTFNQGVIKGYLNGVLGFTVTKSGMSNIKEGPYSQNIGRRTTDKYLDGELPVFKLYGSELSQADVTKNYNAYKKRFNL
tara:strand:- start:3096 stop:4310 length:1215 start_codon:yes stop_codon:yes gene_type:complete